MHPWILELLENPPKFKPSLLEIFFLLMPHLDVQVVPKINIIIDNFNIQQEVFKIIHNARLEFLSSIISFLLWSVTRSVGKHGFSSIEKVKK